jgi:hypothetical protein
MNNAAAPSLRNLSLAVTLSLGSLLGLVGCDPGPSDETADQAAEETTVDPLRGGGGGGGQGFTCSGFFCTCTGDADCNDMFGSGKCGDITSCDTSGPEPVCSCLMFSKPKPPVTGTKATTTGTATTRATR